MSVETGSEIVPVEATVIVEDGEAETVIVDLPEGEEVAPVSDAVAIAEIEANKEITIAAIQTDATIAAIEGNNEIEAARIEVEIEREKSWQVEAERLQANMMELTSQVESLSTALADLSRPTSQPELTVEILDPETETLSTQQSMLEETAETLTEVTPGEGEENPAGVIIAIAEPPAKRRRRLI